jgi:hypothetical protein
MLRVAEQWSAGGSALAVAQRSSLQSFQCPVRLASFRIVVGARIAKLRRRWRAAVANLSAFREFKRAFVPEGHHENSPAF